MADAKRDNNYVTVLLGTSNADDATPIRVYADPATQRLLVDINLVTHTAVGDGRLTVTTAGTRVQFASQACKKVIITAEIDNTDAVVVGGSTVVGALATRRGAPLFTGSSITVDISNMNLLYLDSVVDTEGVTFVYLS